VNGKRRTLQEVCELATREYDTHRLSALVEEILELLAEAQEAKAKKLKETGPN
jgi:hypothetical protein